MVADGLSTRRGCREDGNVSTSAARDQLKMQLQVLLYICGKNLCAICTHRSLEIFYGFMVVVHKTYESGKRLLRRSFGFILGHIVVLIGWQRMGRHLPNAANEY